MGREYVVQTWVKHEPNDPRVIPDHMIDDSAGYSGEQVGNRLARSHGNTRIRSSVPGWYEDGGADLSAYADQNEISRDNPLFSVHPSYKILANFQEIAERLRKQLDAGLMSEKQYDQAMLIAQGKAEKAEIKLNKDLAAARELVEPEQEITEPEEEIRCFDYGASSEAFTEEELKEALKYQMLGLT